MKQKTKISLLLTCVVLSLLLTGCAETQSSDSNLNSEQKIIGEENEEKNKNTVKAPEIVTVKIYDDGYKPQEITIKEGDTVKWVNEGSKDHTVQSDMFPQISTDDKKYSGRLAPGERWEKTISQDGIYNYHDIYHEGLKGKVVVEE